MERITKIVLQLILIMSLVLPILATSQNENNPLNTEQTDNLRNAELKIESAINLIKVGTKCNNNEKIPTVEQVESMFNSLNDTLVINEALQRIIKEENNGEENKAKEIGNSYTFNTIIKCLIVYSNSVGNNINYLIKNVSEEVFIDLIYRLLKEQHLQEEKDEILSYDTFLNLATTHYYYASIPTTHNKILIYRYNAYEKLKDEGIYKTNRGKNGLSSIKKKKVSEEVKKNIAYELNFLNSITEKDLQQRKIEYIVSAIYIYDISNNIKNIDYVVENMNWHALAYLILFIDDNIWVSGLVKSVSITILNSVLTKKSEIHHDLSEKNMADILIEKISKKNIKNILQRCIKSFINDFNLIIENLNDESIVKLFSSLDNNTLIENKLSTYGFIKRLKQSTLIRIEIALTKNKIEYNRFKEAIKKLETRFEKVEDYYKAMNYIKTKEAIRNNKQMLIEFVERKEITVLTSLLKKAFEIDTFYTFLDILVPHKYIHNDKDSSITTTYYDFNATNSKPMCALLNKIFCNDELLKLVLSHINYRNFLNVVDDLLLKKLETYICYDINNEGKERKNSISLIINQKLNEREK